MRTRLSGSLVVLMAAAVVTAGPASASTPIDAKWVPAPPVPSPSGAKSSALNDVSVLSPTDVWTVGSWWDADEHPLAVHWNGTKWTLAVMPKSEPTPVSEEYRLSGVDGVAAADVWAVGSAWPQVTDPPVTSALLWHYDGSTWSDVPAPPVPAGTEQALSDVDMRTASDGWAVGDTTVGDRAAPLILRWQSGQWTPAIAPKIRAAAHLTSVAAVSADDAWAVGTQLRVDGGTGTLLLHWDGVDWTEVTLPGPAGTADETLSSVAATSATNVWVAGSTGKPGSSNCLPLILRFSGGAWQKIPAAVIAAELTEVIAFAPGDVWVIGQAPSATGAQVEHAEHWDGQRFTADAAVVVSPGGKLGTAIALAAAAGDPATGVLWAVGWVDRPVRQPNAIHRG